MNYSLKAHQLDVKNFTTQNLKFIKFKRINHIKNYCFYQLRTKRLPKKVHYLKEIVRSTSCNKKINYENIKDSSCITKDLLNTYKRFII